MIQPVPDQHAVGGLRISWRILEWAGVWFALLLQTGAPILLFIGSGDLDTSRSALRLFALPAYAITIVLAGRHWRQIAVALRRGLPLIVLTLLPFLSVAWSTSGSISLRRAVGLLFTIALAYVIATRFTPRQLLMIVAAVVLPCMVLSLAVGIAVPSIGQMPPGAEVSGMRGIFVHKNILGWYAALAVIVSMFLTAERMVPRVIGLALTVMSLAALAASGSMTGAMCVAASFVLIGVLSALRRLKGATRILLVLVLAQSVTVFIFLLEPLLLPALEALGRDATLTGRVPLWHLVDEEIGRNLLLGVGYQAFWTEANPDAWRIWAAVGWPAPHAHNGYRDMMLNFGLIGFLAFAVCLVRAVEQGTRLHIVDRAGSWLWLNVYFGVFLVMNLTESAFFIQNDTLFILFATAIIMYDLRAPESRPARMRVALANNPAVDASRPAAFRPGLPEGAAAR